MKTPLFLRPARVCVSLLLPVLIASGCSRDAEPVAPQTAASIESGDAAPISPALLTPYLAIQTALAGDTLDGVPAHAEAIARIGDQREDRALQTARQIAATGSIATAREHFEIVSRRMIELVTQHGVAGVSVRKAYCPMAFNNRGAAWLQGDAVLANPYFGARMLRCGEFQGEFSPHA